MLAAHWGGIGRTGTVVGCYLVRHGASPDEALRSPERWLEEMEVPHHPTMPQTEDQFAMVRGWQAGK